jgi:hypothetical protein
VLKRRRSACGCPPGRVAAGAPGQPPGALPGRRACGTVARRRSRAPVRSGRNAAGGTGAGVRRAVARRAARASACGGRSPGGRHGRRGAAGGSTVRRAVAGSPGGAARTAVRPVGTVCGGRKCARGAGPRVRPAADRRSDLGSGRAAGPTGGEREAPGDRRPGGRAATRVGRRPARCTSHRANRRAAGPTAGPQRVIRSHLPADALPISGRARYLFIGRSAMPAIVEHCAFGYMRGRAEQAAQIARRRAGSRLASSRPDPALLTRRSSDPAGLVLPGFSIANASSLRVAWGFVETCFFA